MESSGFLHMATTNQAIKRTSLAGDPNITSEAFPTGLNIPLPIDGSTPVEYAEILGEAYSSSVKHGDRKNGGHYLTPALVARFMAECAAYSQPYLRVLDPGSGAGVLSAAVCETAAIRGTVRNLHIDSYETDHLLAALTRISLAFSREWLAQSGVTMTFNVMNDDFVLAYSDVLQGASKAKVRAYSPDKHHPEFGLVISNPPYFKIAKNDPRAIAGASVVHGQPNIYALFMAVSAELLSESGNLVYIVPRSFAAGPYFRRFREVFFESVAPTAIHLFDSRKDVFKNQTVLQENLVIAARKRAEGEAPDEGKVVVTHSKGARDLAHRQSLTVGLKSVMDLNSENKELCIPANAGDLELVQKIRSWPNTLHSLGLDISTGPVVPFRAKQLLAQAPEPSTVPLLWMHHVHPMRVEWPSISIDKPQWIKDTTRARKLLVADETYVLLRRFSTKEENRRLVAAPLIQNCLNTQMLGLENHLNYIRGVSSALDENLAYGLAALLNSVFLDRYFRLSNGNTQVSATELRIMPLPAEKQIRSIGSALIARLRPRSDLTEIDALAARILGL